MGVLASFPLLLLLLLLLPYLLLSLGLRALRALCILPLHYVG